MYVLELVYKTGATANINLRYMTLYYTSSSSHLKRHDSHLKNIQLQAAKNLSAISARTVQLWFQTFPFGLKPQSK